MFSKTTCKKYIVGGKQNLRDAREYVHKAMFSPRVVIFFLGSKDCLKHKIRAIKYELSTLIQETRSKWRNCDIYFTTAIPELTGEGVYQGTEPIHSYNTMLKNICEINNAGIINISELSGKEELFNKSHSSVFSDAGIRYFISKIKNSIRNAIYRKTDLDVRRCDKQTRTEEHPDNGWSPQRNTRTKITQKARTSHVRSTEFRRNDAATWPPLARVTPQGVAKPAAPPTKHSANEMLLEQLLSLIAKFKT